MINSLEKIYNDLIEYGLKVRPEDVEYLKKSLLQAFLEGRIATLKEIIEDKEKHEK